MSYQPWKALERRHAKRMGGERLWRPDFGDSAPDGETDLDVWDAKAYAKFRVHTIFAECERKYRQFAAGRRFHLVLFSREHPRVGDLVVVHADRYAELVAKERLADGIVGAITEFDPPFQESPCSADRGTCVCAETSTRNCPEHANAGDFASLGSDGQYYAH